MIRIILILSMFSASANAACVWQWDCSSSNCQQVPLCENSYDVVPPRPPGVRPIPLPTVRPVPTPTVPPVGTSHCSKRYICDGGYCAWKTVCN